VLALQQVGRQLETVEALGRVVIEADPTVLQVRPELDVVLEPGDRIYMPKRPNFVSIIGDVLNPGALQFLPGTSPALDPARRERLVARLMRARADVRRALREGDDRLLERARRRVHSAKVALGERGPVWWSDGAPDENRRLARNTPYAAWYKTQHEAGAPAREASRARRPLASR
jgi:hypothetical protein